MRTILILLALATTADAQLFRRGRRVVRQPQTIVRVEQPAIAVQPVQLAFVLADTQPSQYGAPQYTPSSVIAQERQQQADLLTAQEELVGLIRELVGRVNALERKSRPPAPPKPEGPPISEGAMIQAKCGNCHGGANPDGDFRLDDLQHPGYNKLAVKRIELGEMPEGADLPEAERKILIAAIERMRK